MYTKKTTDPPTPTKKLKDLKFHNQFSWDNTIPTNSTANEHFHRVSGNNYLAPVTCKKFQNSHSTEKWRKWLTYASNRRLWSYSIRSVKAFNASLTVHSSSVMLKDNTMWRLEPGNLGNENTLKDTNYTTEETQSSFWLYKPIFTCGRVNDAACNAS